MLRATGTIVAVYVLTCVAAGVTAVTLASVLAPRGCAAMGRTLVALLIVIAAEFVVSAAVVRRMNARRGLPPRAQLGLSLGYALALLVTYVVIAFGLMVAFNC